MAFGLPVLPLLVVGIFAYLAFPWPREPVKPKRQATTALPEVTRKAESLDELLKMPPEQLADVDIGEMNLLCATGLPGAEDLDDQTIRRCLARLDKWAQRVKFETERHLYRLTDPSYRDHAEHYKHSEARFRAEWLIDALQNDVGVHYHAGFVPQDQEVPPFKTSKETFVHGLLNHEDAHKAFGGNCVSMPVIYIAVGRRLGYPVKLVCSKEHVFCRWEGKDHPNPAWRGRFNFDGAGKGFSIDPDQFYLTWPTKSSAEAVALCDWLNSLTPQQELALFMLSRGHVLTHVNKDHAGAQIAYAQAVRLWPTSRQPLTFVSKSLHRLSETQLSAHPKILAAEKARRQRERWAVAQHQQRRPWWQTPQGRAANLAELERINEINRRNMLRLVHPPTVPQPRSPRSPGRPQR